MSLTNEPRPLVPMTEDAILEIQELAVRLQAQLGELDDAAIQAVAEATGAPEDYVRLAVRSSVIPRKTTFVERLKSGFLAFDPANRRYAIAGVLGLGFGLFEALRSGFNDVSGFTGTVTILLSLAALANAWVSPQRGIAAASGALFATVSFVCLTLFKLLIGLLPNVPSNGPAPALLFVFAAVGTLCGVIGNSLVEAYRRRKGAGDAVNERHQLLQQLQDIQQRLRRDERFVTFLSVDMVASTRLKAENDALDVEFTFNEYHRFVQAVAERYGGRLHSTAGDGVTCVFEDPSQACAAGKAVMASLFEFNAFRNKLKSDIELRAGLHTGNVLAPGQSLLNVNFAHVIDVCAHLQKAGAPGSLVVSEETARYVPGGMESLGDEVIVVQEIRAVLWRPRASVETKSLTARPV